MPASDRRTWVIPVACALVLCTGGAGLWASKQWPFTRDALTRSLEEESGGKVAIGQFRETWFPPGCVATDVGVSGNGIRVLTVRSLAIQATWHGLLGRHVHRMVLTGLHLVVPPSESSTALLNPSTSKSDISGIGEVEIDGGLIEFLPHHGQTVSNVFRIKRVVLDHLAKNRTASFRASFSTEKPPGEVTGEGRAGPWRTDQLGAIPISGTYRLANADLKVFQGLSGKLSAEGRFGGVLSKPEVNASVDVPQFHVDGSAHSEHLTATVRATVDSHSADTVLENVEARVGRTVVLATGTVTGDRPAEGKTAHLQMIVNTGRIEDLLNYFSEEKKPSMTGAVRLRASVELPPGPGFLKKVKLTGDFGVAGGEFTNPKNQIPVDRLSQSAFGGKAETEDARTVLTNLKGHVVINNGMATFANVSFEFPGNSATLNGTCELIPMTVNFHGILRTDGKLSDATTGFKALMLKVATPFLKKKSDVTVVPFAITGPASNPSVTLDLFNKTKL